jgi:hypothetical protein
MARMLAGRPQEFGYSWPNSDANPEGIGSFSPGLRGTSHPGCTSDYCINSERVESKEGVRAASHHGAITGTDME